MKQWLKIVGVAVVALVVGTLVHVAVAPASSTSAIPDAGLVVDEPSPSALFVGDSFPAGSGAPTIEEAVSCLTAKQLGWICNRDAQPGTGFVANGHVNDPTFARLIDRLDSTRNRYLADIVIIDAGRNDRHAPAAELLPAMTAYLEAVREAWPEAELVVIEPYVMDSTEAVLPAAVLEHLRAETKRLGGHVINPQADGWIIPGGDHMDLDAEDHRYIASRLVTALRELGLDDVEITDERVGGAQ